MRKLIVPVTFVTALAFAAPALACDFHKKQQSVMGPQQTVMTDQQPTLPAPPPAPKPQG